MSQFTTPLPVNLTELTSLLPPGSTVDSIVWDKAKSQLLFTWSTDKLRSPYHTMEFPLSDLQDGVKPAGVVDKVAPEPKPAPPEIAQDLDRHVFDAEKALSALQAGNPAAVSKAALGKALDRPPRRVRKHL